MAGSKKIKSNKVRSPAASQTPSTSADDQELVDDLLAELDSRDATVQAETAGVLKDMQLNDQAQKLEQAPKFDAKSRFRARQARKAAALAETYAPDNPEADALKKNAAEAEERTIKKVCDELDLKLHEVSPDGHCLFSAVADQLDVLGILPGANYTVTRKAASDYIYTHPDDFIPFLPSAMGEDAVGATESTGIMTPSEFEQYCKSMRDTAAWGGEPEILALCKVYNTPIHVIQGGTPPIVEHNPSDTSNGDIANRKVISISYHRRMYGLGEHYNSLRPKSSLGRITSSIQSLIR